MFDYIQLPYLKCKNPIDFSQYIWNRKLNFTRKHHGFWIMSDQWISGLYLLETWNLHPLIIFLRLLEEARNSSTLCHKIFLLLYKFLFKLLFFIWIGRMSFRSWGIHWLSILSLAFFPVLSIWPTLVCRFEILKSSHYAGVPCFTPSQDQRRKAHNIKALLCFTYLCDTEFSLQSPIVDKIKYSPLLVEFLETKLKDCF